MKRQKKTELSLQKGRFCSWVDKSLIHVNIRIDGIRRGIGGGDAVGHRSIRRTSHPLWERDEWLVRGRQRSIWSVSLNALREIRRTSGYASRRQNGDESASHRRMIRHSKHARRGLDGLVGLSLAVQHPWGLLVATSLGEVGLRSREVKQGGIFTGIERVVINRSCWINRSRHATQRTSLVKAPWRETPNSGRVVGKGGRRWREISRAVRVVGKGGRRWREVPRSGRVVGRGRRRHNDRTRIFLPFSWWRRLWLLKETLVASPLLHGVRVVQRDLKPQWKKERRHTSLRQRRSHWFRTQSWVRPSKS